MYCILSFHNTVAPHHNATGMPGFIGPRIGPTQSGVNYSLSGDDISPTVGIGITMATLPIDGDKTNDGGNPGGPVTDSSGGGLISLFTGDNGRRNLIGFILIVSALVAILATVVLVIVCCCRRRKRQRYVQALY